MTLLEEIDLLMHEVTVVVINDKTLNAKNVAGILVSYDLMTRIRAELAPREYDNLLVKAVRRQNLRTLVESKLGTAAFCRWLAERNEGQTLLDNYVSQMLNGHCSFGEKSARNIERLAGLSAGYFDTVQV